ncbi:MAG: hypothetical protein QXO15_07135 [Nitrososphaerota archaeon]
MNDKRSLSRRLGLRDTIFDYPYDISIEVRKKGESEVKYYDPILALSEACPGNVTARFSPNGDFEWIPIRTAAQKLINCDRIFNFWDEGKLISSKLLRPREKDVLNVWHKDEDEIFLLRIKSIYSLEKFANPVEGYSNEWIYCKRCYSVGHRNEHKNHEFGNLRVDTESFPIIIKYLEPSFQGKLKSCPTWFQEIITQIEFYDTYNRRITLYEGAIGVSVTLKMRGESFHLHDLYGFEYKNKPAAVGYECFTEGFKVSIDSNRLENKLKEFLRDPKNKTTLQNIYIKFIIHKLAYILIKEEKVSPFDAELIGKILVSMFTFNIIDNCTNSVIEEIFLSRVHPVTRETITSFIKSDSFAKYKELARRLLKSIEENEEFLEYLKYTFIHSLSHAFLLSSCSCSGAGENELDEYIKVHGKTAEFFIYERPLNGSTRIIERNFLHMPGEKGTIDLLYYLENLILSCPIGDAEDFLYGIIFKLTKNDIETIKNLLYKLEKREISIEVLLSEFSKITKCCIPTNAVLLEKLRKLLCESIIREKNLNEFNLHFEIYLLYSYLKQKIKREPFLEEFLWVLENLDKINEKELYQLSLQEGIKEDLVDTRKSFSELRLLKNLINDRKIFLEEVQKRYLRSCADGCPSCIGISCREEMWGLSKYSISRNLLKEIILSTIKDDMIIVTSFDKNLPIWQKTLEKLKNRRFIFLASLDEHKQELSKAIEAMVQNGANIRDFRVIKMTDGKYYYVTLVVI